MAIPPDFHTPDERELAAMPFEDQAAAFVSGTRMLYRLLNDTVWRVIESQISPSHFEQALSATYFRIVLLLRGVVALDDPCHFQIANSVARTVFELVLDLKALSNDPSQTRRFFDFPKVAKFRYAEKLVSFLHDHPSIDRGRFHHQINCVDDPQRRQQVRELCLQDWGCKGNGAPKWPDHWSGKNIADRAREAGLELEEMYRSQFFLQSQYVHAGPAGVQDLSRDALICSFAIAHEAIQRLAVIATQIVGDTFHLFDTIPGLRDNLKQQPDHAIVLYLLKAYEQKRAAVSDSD